MSQRLDDMDDTEHGWSFAETERRQRLSGLALTPLERLRWLDRHKKELQSLLGRAAKPADGAGDERGSAAGGTSLGRLGGSGSPSPDSLQTVER
jgi:hypothetical protein